MIVNLLKSMRIERTLIPLSHMLVAIGLMRSVNSEILILGLCCILIYATGGVLNAKVDNDFKIKGSGIFIFFLIGITLFISFSNMIIFSSVILWVALSFIYNKHSRKILFGDSVLLSLTHAVLPIFSGLILLGANINFAILTSSLYFFVFLCSVPIKNLNGIEEDLERGYKTLLTLSREGKYITYALFNFYLIFILSFYFIFNLSKEFFIVFFAILFVKLIMDYLLLKDKKVETYKFGRLIVILSGFAIIVGNRCSLELILVGFVVVLTYMIYMVLDMIGEIR